MKNLGGLSPLARGTLSLRSGRRLRNRFIPAGAGNTVFRTSRGLLGPVYPRWRGEHLLWRWRTEYRCGLSPLARGTQKDIRSPALPNRFIPAGAGNTSRCRSCSGSGPVYPRWRGEHAHCEYLSLYKPGLSPLARGTLTPARGLTFNPRFIPAGAGNTTISCGRAYAKSVYPRWRGEHNVLIKRPGVAGGLSPLARGTPERRGDV